MQPLAGVTVLDFSTLLPGPLASLMLAEAGADVIRIERPDGGDEMRGYEPRFGTDSANFAILNRGKKSIAIDLKRNDAFERLKPLLSRADVLTDLPLYNGRLGRANCHAEGPAITLALQDHGGLVARGIEVEPDDPYFLRGGLLQAGGRGRLRGQMRGRGGERGGNEER